MKEPIIVSAFWDVGRSKDCEFPRSNDRYYREFAEWARIQNRLIIYTDKYSKSEIEKIRAEYGLSNQTIVIEIDIFEIEKTIYNKMKLIEQSKDFYKFRYRPEAMENKASFDYAWFMKYWCLADAVKYANEDDVFAWFDFGFNHTDRCFSNMKEFDFKWILNKEINKVQAYSLKPVVDVSIINVLQFMQDTIMGVFFLVPVKHAEDFWQTIKQAMLSLLMIGCIDDDQVLVLMAYKWRPDLIQVNVSEWWYLPLKETGATNLSVEFKKEKKTLKHIIWAKLYDFKHSRQYMKLTKERMIESIDKAF